MALRVTQNMMGTQLIRNLSRNLLQSDKIQNQMSTGRKINKPSDDPVGITYALRYRSELSNNEQYQKNASNAASYLDYTDTLLSQTEDIFKRLKELAVKASTETNPQEALDAIHAEVKEMRAQLVDVGNSRINGKYVFNGQMTDIPPYSDATAAGDTTDPYAIDFQLGAGVKLPINITGNAIFGDANASDNAFQILDDLMNALQSTTNTAAIRDISDRVSDRLTSIVSVHAEIGARTNRLELVQNRLSDEEYNVNGQQAFVEDVDYDKLIIASKINENIYQASLSVGAKIISPSLVDFLR